MPPYWLAPARGKDPVGYKKYTNRGLGHPAPGRVGLGAIVVEAQAGELRQEMNQVQPAVLVAPADVLLGNIVAARAHPRAHAREVQLGAGEPDEQQVDLRALFRGLREQLRERAPSERRLEGEIETLGDGSLEQPAALLPGGTVRLRLFHAGARGHQRPRGFVGVVVLPAELADRRAADAALARAVDPGEDVDAGRNDYLRRLRAGRAADFETAARPSSPGEALNAASTPFLALGVCMRARSASNSASSPERLCVFAFTSAWNSS